MNRALETSHPDAQQPQGHGDRPLLLTQIQVCRRLGISVQTWRNWRARGRTPATVDLPGRPRWRAADIDAFASRLNVAPRRTFFNTARRSA